MVSTFAGASLVAQTRSKTVYPFSDQDSSVDSLCACGCDIATDACSWFPFRAHKYVYEVRRRSSDIRPAPHLASLLSPSSQQPLCRPFFRDPGKGTAPFTNTIPDLFSACRMYCTFISFHSSLTDNAYFIALKCYTLLHSTLSPNLVLCPGAACESAPPPPSPPPPPPPSHHVCCTVRKVTKCLLPSLCTHPPFS